MPDGLRQHLARGALGLGGLGILSKALSLLISVLLARALGAAGYGYYAFALASINFIAIPALLGLPQLLTRETAATVARAEWNRLNGLRQRAIQIATVATTFSAVVLGGLILAFADRMQTLDRITFAWALLLLPLLVANSLVSSLLGGLRRVVYAYWPVAVLLPTLFLIFLVAMYRQNALVATTAVMANIASTLVVLLVSVTLLRNFWPTEARHVRADCDTGTWVRALAPFSLLAGINIINQKVAILALGVLTTPADVGVYNVAAQTSMFVSFFLATFNTVLAPNVARLHARGEHTKLQRLMTISTLGISAVAAFVAITLLVFGEWLLTNVFGEAYGTGYNSLAILVLGQLANACMGSVALFLSMTGHEKDTLKALAASAVLNVLLNFILIPPFGMTGAAIATSASVVSWNLLLSVKVYRRLGMVPGLLGNWRRRTSQ